MDGKQDWEEYQHAVQEESLDWEEKLEKLAGSRETRDGLKVFGRSAWKAAKRGIGKKEVNEHSKGGGQLSNPSKKRGM